MENNVIRIVNRIIAEYFNNKREYLRIRSNMLWVHDNNPGYTLKQAFAYVMQGIIYMYDAKKDEYEPITNTLWQVLEGKNHSLTKLW